MRLLHDVVLGIDAPQVAALPLSRSKLPDNLGPFYSEIVAPRTGGAAEEAPIDDMLERLGATPEAERPALVTAFLSNQIARVLALGAASRVDPDRSLIDMGMDSLMAMELRNRIQSAVKVPVAVANLLAGASVQQLTTLILSTVDLSASANAAPASDWEEGSL
jgi:aryl carrier-like protein